MQRGSLVVLCCGLAACEAGDRLDAPPPVARAEQARDSTPPLPPSVIDLPVSYDLAPAMAWLEAAIPMRLGDLDERRETGNDRLTFTFHATRTPFRLHVAGTTATLSTVVSYQGRGWYNPPVLPTITGSCGINEPPRRVRLTARTSITPTDDWRLQSRSRIVELAPLTDTPRDQCVVTAAAVNVTERVLEAVRGVLDGELTRVDRQLARYDLRGRAEALWTFLNTPLRLQDSLWLVVAPAAVRLDAVTAEGTTLRTAVGLTAYPRVLSGAVPSVMPLPLPPLERGGSRAGLSLMSEATLHWDVLTGILRRELAGDTLRIAGRTLRLADVAVSGLDDGRVAVRLTLEGDARGTVYLVGTPHYDAREAVLTMPDMEFDVQSRSLMVAGLDWLAGGQVEEHLRRSLRLSLAGVLDDGLALLQRELSRPLAPGAEMRTEITGGQVFRVRARAHALLVDAIAQGRAELGVTVAPGGGER